MYHYGWAAVYLPPDLCASTGGLRKRCSIAARRSVIDGLPGGLGVVLVEGVGAVAETGAVTAVDMIAAAEPLVGVEEPSSVDIPCTGEGRSEERTKIQVDQKDGTLRGYHKAMCL